MATPDDDGSGQTHARIDPVIGVEVAGYKIVARLGNGGMGIVYEGEHALIGKRVAIKVLRHEVAENPDVVQRLVAEARAVNKVGHRGIIDVFGFGTLPDGRQCIVMEYLDGEPLEDVLQRHVRANQLLPVADVLLILDEICSALSAAHSAGVVHRDLKPSNVFLCAQRDGTKFVKLLDFGIAKLGAAGGIQSSIVIGTPTYMAPEQAAKGLVTPALDLYSLGVMAFELLAGRPPFLADSPVALLFMHAKEAPPKLTQLVGDLPVELEALIERLLAKRPADRPENAAVVRLELNRIRKLLPSRGSGILTVDVQSPRASQSNLPRVQLATDPGALGSTAIVPPRASPAAEVRVQTPPQQSQPGPPVASSPSPMPSQAKLPVASSPSPKPSQASLPVASSPSPKPSHPAVDAPSLPRDSVNLEASPAPSSRGRPVLVAGIAIVALAGGGYALSSREPPPTALPPPAPVAIEDAGQPEPIVQPAPVPPDASAPEPLAELEDAGVAEVPISVDAGAKPEPSKRPTGKSAKLPKDPATSIAARISKLEARLAALAKDPDQNVGIYQSQLKALKARVTGATTRAELDTLELTLRRLEADIDEL